MLGLSSPSWFPSVKALMSYECPVGREIEYDPGPPDNVCWAIFSPLSSYARIIIGPSTEVVFVIFPEMVALVSGDP